MNKNDLSHTKGTKYFTMNKHYKQYRIKKFERDNAKFLNVNKQMYIDHIIYIITSFTLTF